MKRLLPKTIKRIIRAGVNSAFRGRRLIEIIHDDLMRYIAPRFITPLPWEVNALANDICNSRCQMCLIWEQKKKKELSPEEWLETLSNPFFRKVRYVGFTGGEPTLRTDLPAIFSSAIKALPSLRGLSTITNAIREKDVIDRVTRCASVCADAGVQFSVMVSLDGVGAIHDAVRGRAGNYQSAINCLRQFNAAGYRTAFGCTITSSNADHVDELLDLAIEEGWYGRFRVAEFIKRLYNDSQTTYIRNFTPKQCYHLALFFYRLETCFEPAPIYRKTYRNVREMVMMRVSRGVACPYQSRAVAITSAGEMLYCAPKSPSLGKIKQGTDAEALYRDNYALLESIRDKDCDACIHDYHTPVTLAERIRSTRESVRRGRKYDLRRLIRAGDKLATLLSTKSQFGPFNSATETGEILIVGWYGTETAGDKAILDTIIRSVRGASKSDAPVYISSLHPFVTVRTVEELALDNVFVVEAYSKNFERICESVSEVIFGGGPLMNLKEINQSLYAFIRARRRGASAVIWHCGVGPFNSHEPRECVEVLLRVASKVTVRDEASALLAKSFGVDRVMLGEDPAIAYVRRKADSIRHAVAAKSDGRVKSVVSFYLRDITYEYLPECGTWEQVRTEQKATRERLFEFVKALAAVSRMQVELHAMHCFQVGGDDRELNRWLARRARRDALDAQEFGFNRLPESPEEILESMANSALCICMRFHSVVFACELNVPFIAVDYTGGGKIASYLKVRRKEHLCIPLNRIHELTGDRDKLAALLAQSGCGAIA